jgi:hypothetical protein
MIAASAALPLLHTGDGGCTPLYMYCILLYSYGQSETLTNMADVSSGHVGGPSPSTEIKLVRGDVMSTATCSPLLAVTTSAC